MKLININKILLIILLFSSCMSKVNKRLGLKDDNILEEAIEEKIRNVTGINIDLTPQSPEKCSCEKEIIDELQ